MKAEVKTFFEAKTIAVVGASREPTKVGHIIFKNLLKSNKNIVPINPKATEILGKKVYQDLLEVPYHIDLIIIATPPKTVPLIIRQAGRKKIPTASIISAGFSEIGENEIEQRLKDVAEQEGIRLLGPNSFGILDGHNNFNATFFEGEIKKGNIGFISQSGAIGSAVLDKYQKFSKFISLGNAIDIKFTDLVEYLVQDSNTKIICLYIESLTKNEGRRFIDICKKSQKPIIAIKGGTSEQGQHAAKSHTAALATDSKVYTGVFKQAGIIPAESITQMFNIAKILEKYSKISKKIAIVTNAGGFGVLTTDYCNKNNLILPKLSSQTLSKLNQVLPENWSRNNPIDIIGDASSKRYIDTLSILEKDSTIDTIIVVLTPQYMSEPEKTAKVLLKIKKPIFALFLGGQQIKQARLFMNQFGIINFTEPKELCEALGKILN